VQDLGLCSRSSSHVPLNTRRCRLAKRRMKLTKGTSSRWRTCSLARRACALCGSELCLLQRGSESFQ
jgi:hypothetical protein